MAQTISQTNGAWFKAFMVIFTAATMTFVGYAVGNMGDRHTGTQAKQHADRPYHEGAWQRLAVLSNQMMTLQHDVAEMKEELKVANGEIRKLTQEISIRDQF